MKYKSIKELQKVQNFLKKVLKIYKKNKKNNNIVFLSIIIKEPKTNEIKSYNNLTQDINGIIKNLTQELKTIDLYLLQYNSLLKASNKIDKQLITLIYNKGYKVSEAITEVSNKNNKSERTIWRRWKRLKTLIT